MAETRDSKLVVLKVCWMAEQMALRLVGLKAYLKAGLMGVYLDESKAQRRGDLKECLLVPQSAPH